MIAGMIHRVRVLHNSLLAGQCQCGRPAFWFLGGTRRNRRTSFYVCGSRVCTYEEAQKRLSKLRYFTDHRYFALLPAHGLKIQPPDHPSAFPPSILPTPQRTKAHIITNLNLWFIRHSSSQASAGASPSEVWRHDIIFLRENQNNSDPSSSPRNYQ